MANIESLESLFRFLCTLIPAGVLPDARNVLTVLEYIIRNWDWLPAVNTLSNEEVRHTYAQILRYKRLILDASCNLPREFDVHARIDLNIALLRFSPSLHRAVDAVFAQFWSITARAFNAILCSDRVNLDALNELIRQCRDESDFIGDVVQRARVDYYIRTRDLVEANVPRNERLTINQISFMATLADGITREQAAHWIAACAEPGAAVPVATRQIIQLACFLHFPEELCPVLSVAEMQQMRAKYVVLLRQINPWPMEMDL
jgi:hypothetical protein